MIKRLSIHLLGSPKKCNKIGTPGAKHRSGRKPGARVTNSARLFTPGKKDSISGFKSGCHRRVGGHLTDLKKYGCLLGVEEAKKNM